MTSSLRPSPIIPDHEVLRKIGGGAYGEVWLARGVTGAMRAVKVVRREDFEDERGFEREFEGILKYEPISRDHPALVNILHVGRSPDQVSFYYYVMELGDDVQNGQEINPIEYEPRTLRADTRVAERTRLEPSVCIDVGLRLAEALDHLHERGLAHRDVKPSNVIFVNGQAKLADIGLVAARGQRTFVGTEGFVPPEGPGSAQADVYSLGKVLYEIATGNDRLDFPELPEEMPGGRERKRWIELNRIICEICEPRISKRRITSAGALADALRRIQRGVRRRSGTGAWITTLLLVAFSFWASWQLVKDQPWVAALVSQPSPSNLAPPGLVRVTSSPEGAEVIAADGTTIGITPTGTLECEVGSEVVFTLKMKGYRTYEVRAVVPQNSTTEPLVLLGQLENFSPPVVGETWEDQLGTRYLPVGDEHHLVGYVTRSHWEKFLDVSKRSPQAVEFIGLVRDGHPEEVALVPREEAIAYCDWLRVSGLKAGFLSGDEEVVPQPDRTFTDPRLSERARREGLVPLGVMVRPIAFSELIIQTRPPGADVYLNGQSVGITEGDLRVPKVKPGPQELLVVLEGFKPLNRTIQLEPRESKRLELSLVENQGVVFGKNWENGLGMKFVPLGADLMVSVYETRVGDYASFTSASGYSAPQPADFRQAADHPVVNVSRDDAIAFCDWLTRSERESERIAVSHVYRLPTDMEWSWMAGLDEAPGLGPGWRDLRKSSVFPWGKSWPEKGVTVGNFADVSASLQPGIPAERTISGYDDGFPYTAPVGSFPPNAFGLYDLSGNAHEWVEDAYSSFGNRSLGVVRGGGWNTFQKEQLYSGSRNPLLPGSRDQIYGFRIILFKVPPKNDVPEPPPLPGAATPALNGSDSRAIEEIAPRRNPPTPPVKPRPLPKTVPKSRD